MEFFYDTTKKAIKVEGKVSQFMQYIPKDSDIVLIDVGANWGAYSLLGKFFPRCTVYAIEPNPEAYKELCENILLNNLTNVKAFNIGLSDKNGVGELNVCEADSMLSTLGVPNCFDHPKKIPIELMTLDTFMETNSIPRVHIINIDVQGFERAVLQGGLNTIGKYRPIIQIAHNQSNMAQHQITQEDMVQTIGFLSYGIGSETAESKMIAFNNDWLKNIPAFEKKVYSAAGQDGILSYIFQCIQPLTKTCVEVGFDSTVMERTSGSNTAELMLNRGWTGVLVDPEYQKTEINLFRSDLSRESVISILNTQNVPENFDYLSLNTRTRDVWVLESILTKYKPRVISAWYNCHLPIECVICTVPECDPKDNGTRAYGASLKCFEVAAKDYTIVHVSDPHTVFMIRKDVLGDQVRAPILNDFKKCTGIVWREKPGDANLMLDYKIFLHCKNEKVAIRSCARITSRYISIPNATVGSIVKASYQKYFPKIRVGPNSEGGYVIAEGIPYDCILSAGGPNLGFEEQLARKNRGVPFYVFRSDIQNPEEYKEFMFVHKTLSSVESERYTNLNTYLRNHKNTFVKVVVPGLEYEWGHFIESAPEVLQNISQLVIQFHYLSKGVDKAVGLLDLLTKEMRVIHIHAHNKHGYAYDLNNSLIADTLQITFLNNKHFPERKEYSDIPEVFPNSLDKPDDPKVSEVFLYTHPFYSRTIGKYRVSPWNNPYNDLFEFDILESPKFGLKLLVVHRDAPWGQRLIVRIENLESGEVSMKMIGNSANNVSIVPF